MFLSLDDFLPKHYVSGVHDVSEYLHAACYRAAHIETGVAFYGEHRYASTTPLRLYDGVTLSGYNNVHSVINCDGVDYFINHESERVSGAALNNFRVLNAGVRITNGRRLLVTDFECSTSGDRAEPSNAGLTLEDVEDSDFIRVRLAKGTGLKLGGYPICNSVTFDGLQAVRNSAYAQVDIQQGSAIHFAGRCKLHGLPGKVGIRLGGSKHIDGITMAAPQFAHLPQPYEDTGDSEGTPRLRLGELSTIKLERLEDGTVNPITAAWLAERPELNQALITWRTVTEFNKGVWN